MFSKTIVRYFKDIPRQYIFRTIMTFKMNDLSISRYNNNHTQDRIIPKLYLITPSLTLNYEFRFFFFILEYLFSMTNTLIFHITRRMSRVLIQTFFF